MATMKSVQTAAAGTIEVTEIDRPVPGPRDVLVRVRACGICGTDAAFVQMGGMPLGPGGQPVPIALGHEPAGEIDAAGAAVVVNTALRAAKWGAKLVTVAVHKKPEPIDLGAMLRSEMTIIASQGYPTEIFEVTAEIAEYETRFSRLISHRVPFSDVGRAFRLVLTPGAAEKVIVTFDD